MHSCSGERREYDICGEGGIIYLEIAETYCRGVRFVKIRV